MHGLEIRCDSCPRRLVLVKVHVSLQIFDDANGIIRPHNIKYKEPVKLRLIRYAIVMLFITVANDFNY